MAASPAANVVSRNKPKSEDCGFCTGVTGVGAGLAAAAFVRAEFRVAGRNHDCLRFGRWIDVDGRHRRLALGRQAHVVVAALVSNLRSQLRRPLGSVFLQLDLIEKSNFFAESFGVDVERRIQLDHRLRLISLEPRDCRIFSQNRGGWDGRPRCGYRIEVPPRLDLAGELSENLRAGRRRLRIEGQLPLDRILRRSEGRNQYDEECQRRIAS